MKELIAFGFGFVAGSITFAYRGAQEKLALRKEKAALADKLDATYEELKKKV